jgi:hypothetical protein
MWCKKNWWGAHPQKISWLRQWNLHQCPMYGPEHRRTAPPPMILSTVPHTSTTTLTNQTSRSVLATPASTLPSGQSTRREQEQYPSQAISIAPDRHAPPGTRAGSRTTPVTVTVSSGSSAATCRPAVRGHA